MRPTKTSSWFSRLAKATSHATGRPAAFLIACIVVLAWALTGPIFRWSDTWQLVINTGTTIATFLMVFLIQNTQNRDTESLQIKLDELIRVTEGAHNALLDLEELEEREFDAVRRNYQNLAKNAREGLVQGIRDTGRADLEAGEIEPKGSGPG
jgi:low affinity Fe/Cu permease